MIVIKADRMSKYAEASQARHEDRIQRILDITDQEVMEKYGIKEETEEAEDVLYAYYNGHLDEFYIITGFNMDEFNNMFTHVEEKFTAPGRGRKPKASPRDILIILLHYLKRYPRIEELSVVFSMKPSTLQTIIAKYIPIMSEVMKKDFIEKAAEEKPAYDQRFPNCPYVVDATVQKICKPSLTFEFAKKYFSGKHYIYCLKSQVVVTIKGLAVSVISGIEGSVHDKRLFDNSIPELNKLFNLHPDIPHMIIGDKGYQEPDSQLLVTPYKGNAVDLTKEQLGFNQKLGEVRIIIENFFGRLKSRYEIMGSTYRGCHENYADIFTLCCALVNFEQIECDHPLRDSDQTFYVKLGASLNQEKQQRDEKARERRKKQAKARRKRFAHVRSSSDESSDSDSD